MRIVVDTSVAKSAGSGRPEANPPSPACVAALEAIRHSDMTVAFSAELKTEWQRHAKSYAMKWLGHLIARKRFEALRGDWEGTIALLDAAAGLPGRQPEEIAKDVHLVGLGMITDRRILSCDMRQRDLLRQILTDVPAIASLHWASPIQTETLAWLCSGAPETLDLQLRQDKPTPG